MDGRNKKEKKRNHVKESNRNYFDSPVFSYLLQRKYNDI